MIIPNRLTVNRISIGVPDHKKDLIIGPITALRTVDEEKKPLENPRRQ